MTKVDLYEFVGPGSCSILRREVPKGLLGLFNSVGGV